MAKWPYSTQTWQRLRDLKLREEPLCEHCMPLGRVTPATDVDHVEAISSGGEPFPPLSGLAALCKACHQRKTHGTKPVVDPQTGMPMSGEHWWRT